MSGHTGAGATGHGRASFVWVVLPAFNEAANIGELITRIARALPAGHYHVVVVDDGSQDSTAEVARLAARQAGCPLTVLRHPRNEGLPSTLRDGLRWAATHAGPGDAVVCMDADNSQPPELIPELCRQLAFGYDVAVASRYRRGARQLGVSPKRRLLSWGVNLLLRLTAPLPGVRDYTSGFRAYRASLLRRAFERFSDRLIESRTFACTAEVLLRLGWLEARITEVPMTLRYDLKQGASKIRALETVLEYLRLMARLSFSTPLASHRLLWLVAVLLFAVPLAAPLTDGDSHYYAAIARQMLNSRDWLTPRHPSAPDAIVDKPPLTFWAMALSFLLFGVNEAAARIWQVFMGLAVIWLTVDIGRLYLPERAALRAGWVLLTSVLFWYAVLVPQQDVATLFFGTLALWAALSFRRNRRPWQFYLVWVALAGELLTRGPLGLALFGAILALFAATSMRYRLRLGSSWKQLLPAARSHLLHTGVGLGLFTALALPWFVAEAVTLGPAFVEVFFTSGNARFFSSPGGTDPWVLLLGYIPLLALAFIPWSGFVPAAVKAAMTGPASLPAAPSGHGHREVDERTLVLVWAVVAFVLPHLIAWRVIRYLLPTLPPLALLVAERLDGWEQAEVPSRAADVGRVQLEQRRSYWLTVALLGAVVTGMLALLGLATPEGGESLKPFAAVFVAAFGAGTLLYGWLGRRSATAGRRTLIAMSLITYLALGTALALYGDRAFPQRL